jgi:hypothetical protein
LLSATGSLDQGPSRFYSYISHGLARELGIATGYGSVVAYSVFEASLCGGFAYFLGLKLNARSTTRPPVLAPLAPNVMSENRRDRWADIRYT